MSPNSRDPSGDRKSRGRRRRAQSAGHTAKHGLIRLAKVVAKEVARHGVRANVICPGFVRTALVDKQIPEQARALGLSEDAVVKEVMLKDTVDGEFTTTQNVAEAALFFALPLSNRTHGPASHLS